MSWNIRTEKPWYIATVSVLNCYTTDYLLFAPAISTSYLHNVVTVSHQATSPWIIIAISNQTRTNCGDWQSSVINPWINIGFCSNIGLGRIEDIEVFYDRSRFKQQGCPTIIISMRHVYLLTRPLLAVLCRKYILLLLWSSKTASHSNRVSLEYWIAINKNFPHFMIRHARKEINTKQQNLANSNLFHQLGPTGPSWSRSHHVRLSVCLCVCLRCLSKGGPRGAKPLIGPQITWSDPGLSLVNPPPSPFNNASGKKVTVLLSASVDRFGVSRVRDFFVRIYRYMLKTRRGRPPW